MSQGRVMVEIELFSLDGRERVGVYETVMLFRAPTDFPKRLAVPGGRQVWVMGEFALFRLTARRN